MRAVVQNAYGQPDVLRLVELEKPAPVDDQVLVKVHAVSINGADWETLVGSPLYARMGGLLRPPKNHIPGSDIAGRVEAVGPNVKDFQVGDEVFGETLRYSGGFAEYVCVRERGLAKKPTRLTFEQAAAIPQAGVIALQAMRKAVSKHPYRWTLDDILRGNFQRNMDVLINGAGGSVGLFAVQLAKYHGTRVTGVDHGGKRPFIESLGADHVINYKLHDFTRIRWKYDFVLDPILRRSPFVLQRALKPGGTCYVVGGLVRYMLQVLLFGPIIRRNTGKDIRVLNVQPNREDLLKITSLCVSGEVLPVINMVYPLEQAAQAMRCVGKGHALGKIVIRVAE